MAAHSTLTGADLHELKGADTATAGQIPVFDGAGSSTPTTIANNNLVIVTANMVNISSAGSYWVVPGIAGTITTIYSVIDGAISGADCGLTFEINGTPITGGAITIAQSGSAAGDVDTSSPSAANVITASDAVEMITDGASTGVTIATITLVIDVS